MSKRFLVPSFLQQFDAWLLKHKPAAWSARTHLLLYYIIIFSAIVTLACFVAFSDARQYSAADVWATFIGLAAFTGFVGWLIYLLRFNVFKRFGNWKRWEGLKMFGLYFVNIGALVFLAFIPYIVECVNANNAYDDYELGKDINELNLTACRLEYNLLPKKFKADTIELVKADSTKLNMDEEKIAAVDIESAVAAAAEEVYDEAAAPAEYRPNYTSTADTNVFYGRIMNADSLNKISDSLYVIFECPDYIFAGSYYGSEYGKTAKLRSFEIYNKVIKNYTPPDRPALLKRIKALDEKYVTEHYEPEYYSDKTYTKVIFLQ